MTSGDKRRALVTLDSETTKKARHEAGVSVNRTMKCGYTGLIVEVCTVVATDSVIVVAGANYGFIRSSESCK